MFLIFCCHDCFLEFGLRTRAAQRNDSAQEIIAQVKSKPYHDTEIDRKEHVREEWIANADVRRDSTAQITSQQDRAENRSTRNYIEDRTDQQDDSERNDSRRGISDLNCCVYHGCRLYQFHDAVHKQKQHWKGANNTAGPERFLRNCCSVRFHFSTVPECFSADKILSSLLHAQIIGSLFFIEVLDRVAQSGAWHCRRMSIQESRQLLWIFLTCFAQPSSRCLMDQVLVVCQQQLGYFESVCYVTLSHKIVSTDDRRTTF